jgi:hypothetical protein
LGKSKKRGGNVKKLTWLDINTAGWGFHEAGCDLKKAKGLQALHLNILK